MAVIINLFFSHFVTCGSDGYVNIFSRDDVLDDSKPVARECYTVVMHVSFFLNSFIYVK